MLLCGTTIEIIEFMKRIKLIVFFCLLSFAATAQTVMQADSSGPFVLGETLQIRSAELGEKRILNIYLPEGYKKDDTTRYPVIYLLDGSADEDFIHIVGLVQFNSFSWINRVPKSIVVGIANVNRLRDFTYPTTLDDDKPKYPAAGHSDRFIAYLEKELQPFIEHRYKTSGTRTLIGESLGGLLATEILLEKPSLFNKYIIISPSLWWDNGSLLHRPTNRLNEAVKSRTSVYIGVGKEGLTPGKTPHVMEVDANLLAEKLESLNNKNLTVHFDYLPQEDHATIAHQAVYNAFKVLYP